MINFTEKLFDNHAIEIDFMEMDISPETIEVSFDDYVVKVLCLSENKELLKEYKFTPSKGRTPYHYETIEISNLVAKVNLILRCDIKSRISTCTFETVNIQGTVTLFTGERIYELGVRYSNISMLNFNAFKLNKIYTLNSKVGKLHYFKNKINNPSNAYIMETIDILGKSFITSIKNMVTELLYLSHSGTTSFVDQANIIAKEHYIEGKSVCKHLGVTISEEQLNSPDIISYFISECV